MDLSSADHTGPRAAPSGPRVMVAVTGASGSIYAQRLMTLLCRRVGRIYLVATKAGVDVCRHELAGQTLRAGEVNLCELLAGRIPPELRSIVRVFNSDDLFAPVASGSSVPTHMIVAPCSMGTLARIAIGISSNLIERSADVMMKQKQSLIIVPRETPLSTIHLQNMLTLAQAGCHLVPAMPAFYQQPGSIDELVDFVVGRILELCDIPHDLYRPWNAAMR